MGHHGFGMGRRMCPGIEITEAELLVACGSVVNYFYLNPLKDAEGNPIWPDSNAFTPNLIGGQLPFKFDLKVRSEKHAQEIRRIYEESVAAEASGAIDGLIKDPDMVPDHDWKPFADVSL